MEARSIAAALIGFVFVVGALLLHYYTWVSVLRSSAARTVILYGGSGEVLVEPPLKPWLHYKVTCIPGGTASTYTVNGAKAYACPPGTRSVCVEVWGPGPGWIRFSVKLPVPAAG